VLTPFRQPRQDHARQHVAEAGAAEGQRQVGTHEERRRQQREADERQPHADAQEDGDGVVAAESGMHQPQLQLAHLGRRLRQGAAEPLERFNRPDVGRLVERGPGRPAADLPEPALDRRGAARRQRHGAGRHQQRDERKRENGQ
jgi:hypothetical protein